MATGRRRYTRVEWGEEAWIELPGQEESTYGLIHDISLNGILVDATLDAEAGDTCRVHVPLGEDPEDMIDAEGQIARRDEDSVAINFQAMDLDSAAHLRNLVTYNSSDWEEIEREAEHLRLGEADPGADEG